VSQQTQTAKPKGRGIGKKTQIRKLVEEAAITAEAQLIASQRVKDKFEKKKPISQKMQEFLVSKMKEIDPAEALAIAGTTVIIKCGINWTEEVVAKAQPFINTYNQISEGMLNVIMLGGYDILKKSYLGAVGNPTQPTQQEIQDRLRSESSGFQVEVMEWVISFTLAFLIVRHFGEIMQAGSNILGVAKGLLGIATV